MYLKISRDKLLEQIGIVSKAVSSASPIPQLLGIKFDVHNDYLELTGSNSDTSIKSTLYKDNEFTYEVKEPGSIVINKNYINDIIRRIDSEVVEFEISEGTMVRISGTNSFFEINGFKSSDYPLIDFNLAETNFKMLASNLKKIVSKTSFAVSSSETRPTLTGINFTSDGEKLKAVSTDSFRLAKVEMDSPVENNFNITIAGKNISDISKIFPDEEILSIHLSDKKIQFVGNNLIIQTRLIEGNYPDTSRFVPPSFDYQLVVDKNELKKAIASSSFIKNENDQFAIIKLSLSSDGVIMSTRSQEIGSATMNLQYDEYQGEPLEISFSAKYIDEAVNSLEGDKVVVRLCGSMKPFVLTSPSDISTLQLILPVRTFN